MIAAELRIRLEGRIETVEAAVSKWHTIASALRRRDWYRHLDLRELLDTPAELEAELELIRHDSAGPLVMRLSQERARAAAAARSCFAWLRLEPKGVTPLELVTELRGHLPFEIQGRLSVLQPSAHTLSAAVSAAIAALPWWGSTGFADLHFISMIGVIISSALFVVSALNDATPYAVTRRAIRFGRRAFLIEDLSAVGAGQSNLVSLYLRDGTTATLDVRHRTGKVYGALAAIDLRPRLAQGEAEQPEKPQSVKSGA